MAYRKQAQVHIIHSQWYGGKIKQNTVVLAKMVSKNQRDWHQQLPFAVMAYRSSLHDVTQETPFMIMLGREMDLPLGLITGRPRSQLVWKVQNMQQS